MTDSSAAPRCSVGVATDTDTLEAASRAAGQAVERLGARADLTIAFASAHHADDLAPLSRRIAETADQGPQLALTTAGVISGRLEHERAPCVSVFALHAPGSEIDVFRTSEFPPVADRRLGRDETAHADRALAEAMALGAQSRGTLLFADAPSTPMVNLLPAMNRARALATADSPYADDDAPGPLLGGLVPQGGALALDGAPLRTGGVGVTINAGPIRLDTIVSQGCRAIGENLVITKARKNIILQLGGRPAAEVVRDLIADLDDFDRDLIKDKGLFLGRVINEYKDRFGRGDYLIRAVMGFDRDSASIAVGDIVRVGQTVRFHVRDASAADEDLDMLLDSQRMQAPPIGALLITCNGRGIQLFEDPNHDAEALARAFAGPEEIAGEQKAKAGRRIDSGEPRVPIAGCFAAGEIGPVGRESYLHGHTACIGLFRQR